MHINAGINDSQTFGPYFDLEEGTRSHYNFTTVYTVSWSGRPILHVQVSAAVSESQLLEISVIVSIKEVH